MQHEGKFLGEKIRHAKRQGSGCGNGSTYFLEFEREVDDGEL